MKDLILKKRLITLLAFIKWYEKKFYTEASGEARNALDGVKDLVEQHIKDKWRRENKN